MASLKEIKGRISSVASTLKITSAMKLVASSKLRRAQQAIGNMLPYERELNRILTALMASGAAGALPVADADTPFAPVASPGGSEMARPFTRLGREAQGAPSATATGESTGIGKVAIVAFSSNSSLCGAFNANVIKETLAAIDEYRAAGIKDSDITVYSIGRKMADAMRKAGFPSPADYTAMAASPGFEPAASLATKLRNEYDAGRLSRVDLVYNHFKSTASQPTVRETFLPLTLVSSPVAVADGAPCASRPSRVNGRAISLPPGDGNSFPDDIIIEPSAAEVLEELLPKTLNLKIYTTLLDSNAAEHAARTVAMQTATDNGNDLLQELTLEYNKGRQQKITSEILDIIGGSMQ